MGPGRGRGRDYLKHTPPAPCQGEVWRVKTSPALPRNEHERREAVDWRSRFIVHYASKLRATLTMLTGPIAVIRDTAPFHHMPYERNKFFPLFAMTHGYWLEFLRFTKRKICELAWLLTLPEHFEARCYTRATTALCLVLY